jgi:adenylylsulfate kinase-like enzyme
VVAFDDDDLRQLSVDRSVRDAQGLYMALLDEVSAAVEAGATVVVSTTTSERAYRKAMREAVPHFIEVWLVCADVEIWRREIARTPRFDQATIPVGFPYQPPERVDLLLDSTTRTPAELAVAVVAYLDTLKAHQRSIAA